ncbi:hypothetical protein GCM10028778_26500 [Barrientosiimonas marina]|uniref:Histidine phosphatase family protein n=1 Tax=Lentibacillus kimchii TaxID=1542911 RepID=A0ABW2UUQ0_9BACI
MGRIGFVRHGVTQWNKEARVQGDSDTSLDEEGRQQAQLLRDTLEAADWDRIYVSPQLRAEQTAEILNAKLHKPLHTDARLREASFGLIEGTNEQERVQTWGTDWHKQDLGYETRARVIERGLAVLDEVSRNHPDENVLVVSHGTFIKHLLTELMPQAEMSGSLDNTSLTLLTKDADGWHCDLYNDTRHLPESALFHKG